ncbi:MAG: methyltransferase [Paludibacteraceae bacterium]|nr:methyltransferase [Paludibacteraceae bacterium]
MKVGTDGVLLGAWVEPLPAPLLKRGRILDVGTGSGLIARMLMQRCPQAEVEGIDIDAAAVEQARENGIKAFCSRLQDWGKSIQHSEVSVRPYDLIVSNPPYFQNSLKNPDKGRQTARHTDTLSYDELLAHSARLLSEHGQLALILPAEAEDEVRELAARYLLYCSRVTRVYSKESKPARRVLLCFEKLKIKNEKLKIIEDSLVLENETGGRSAAYSELCKEFYL